jgi:hypothetical protein
VPEKKKSGAVGATETMLGRRSQSPDTEASVNSKFSAFSASSM